MSRASSRPRFIEPHRLVISTALVVGVFVSPAFAGWWVVRSADGVCLVVDIKPTGKDPTVTKVGKDSYRTETEATRTSNASAKNQRFRPNLIAPSDSLSATLSVELVAVAGVYWCRLRGADVPP